MRKRKKNRIDGNFEVMIWIISFQYKRLQFGISPTIFLLKKKDSTSIVSLLVKHPNLSPPSIFIIQEQQQPLTKVIVWFERIFIFKYQKKKKQNTNKKLNS